MKVTEKTSDEFGHGGFARVAQFYVISSSNVRLGKFISLQLKTQRVSHFVTLSSSSQFPLIPPLRCQPRPPHQSNQLPLISGSQPSTYSPAPQLLCLPECSLSCKIFQHFPNWIPVYPPYLSKIPSFSCLLVIISAFCPWPRFQLPLSWFPFVCFGLIACLYCSCCLLLYSLGLETTSLDQCWV